MATKAYEPRYAVHPGSFLKDEIEARGMSQKEFAERTEISEKALSEILNEKANLQPWMALKMESAFGMPAHVWIRLQSTYDETVARNAQDQELADEMKIAKAYPYNEIRKCVPHVLPETKDAGVRYDWIRRLHGVASLKTLITRITQPSASQAHYMDPCLNGAYRLSGLRTKKNTEVDSLALLGWIRAGQILAEELETVDFNKNALSKALPEVRKGVSIGDPIESFRTIRDVLSSCGVKTVYSPYVKCTYANGVTLWDRESRPTIFLTNKQTFWDTMLFSLLHELGHIIRHGRNYFSLSFSETLQAYEIDHVKEKEANTFASDLLIPQDEWNSFVRIGDTTPMAFHRFSAEQKIPVGIVAGRAMHIKLIQYHHPILSERRTIDLDKI